MNFCRGWVAIGAGLLLCCWFAGTSTWNAGSAQGGKGLVEIQQDFSSDPGWEGLHNRVECRDCPMIIQDFGWVPTDHTGRGPGEIGGVIWRSTTPAYYAMPLAPLSFREGFSASGRLAVIAPPVEANGFYIGFFGAERLGRGFRG